MISWLATTETWATAKDGSLFYGTSCWRSIFCVPFSRYAANLRCVFFGVFSAEFCEDEGATAEPGVAALMWVFKVGFRTPTSKGLNSPKPFKFEMLNDKTTSSHYWCWCTCDKTSSALDVLRYPLIFSKNIVWQSGEAINPRRRQQHRFIMIKGSFIIIFVRSYPLEIVSKFIPKSIMIYIHCYTTDTRPAKSPQYPSRHGILIILATYTKIWQNFGSWDTMVVQIGIRVKAEHYCGKPSRSKTLWTEARRNIGGVKESQWCPFDRLFCDWLLVSQSGWYSNVSEIQGQVKFLVSPNGMFWPQLIR